MVHIITEGKLPSEKVYEATCSSCRTFFSFKQGEARYNSDQREGDYLSITCPLPGCGRTVTKQVGMHRTTSYWDR